MPADRESATEQSAELPDEIAPARIPIEPIDKKHVRDKFDCGEPALNEYLRSYARQNDDSDVAKCFVAVDDNKRVLGYYTLSSAGVEFNDLPAAYTKHLPKYPVPAARIGRFAVDTSMQRKKLGARLLIDALQRVARVTGDMAVKVVVVDAKSERAKEFYLHFGFIELVDCPTALFLPVDTIRQLF